MLMGWVQRTRKQGLGSMVTVQIKNQFACPLNLLSPVRHPVRGGVFGSQRGAAGLCATDLLITNICL